MLAPVSRPWALAGLVVLSVMAWAGCARSPATPTPSVYEGTALERPASDFHLLDQRGEPVALSDFRGSVVVLSFLDPECTDVCPLTANQLRLTAEALGTDASAVIFLAVNVNPELNAVADVAGATAKWGVHNLTNWHYVTGSRRELEPVYQAYGVQAEGPPKSNKPNEQEHTPGVFVIDRDGAVRWYVSIPLAAEGEATPWLGPSLSEVLVKRVRELLA